MKKNIIKNSKKTPKNIIKNFESPDNEREYLLAALKIKQKEKESLVQNDFLAFIKHMWPEFIEGYHHKVIAEKYSLLICPLGILNLNLLLTFYLLG